jgi:alanyl-tRNA synthetase
VAKVDSDRRQGICRSHTSTHLLHRSLRNALGDHVSQAGSLVAPDRLRFDFNHFSALTKDQLKAIEAEVNQKVLANLTVQAVQRTLEEAKELGATALFTDKYEENSVRMVSAGDYTLELCGGTHAAATGEIGLFKIISEEGIGSGLRRIEATVGMNSYRQTVERENLLATLAGALNTDEARLEGRFHEHLLEHKALQKSNQDLKQRLAGYEVKNLLSAVKVIDGVKMLSASVAADSLESLRMVMDEVKSNLDSVVVVLGAISDGKVILVGSVTADLVKRGIQAHKIIKEVARQVGGGGGGKPELAQAGGKDPQALPEALASVEALVREQL